MVIVTWHRLPLSFKLIVFTTINFHWIVIKCGETTSFIHQVANGVFEGKNMCMKLSSNFQKDPPFYDLYHRYPWHHSYSIENLADVFIYGLPKPIKFKSSKLVSNTSSHHKTIFIKGKTIIPVCFYQGQNPAHLLFGFGFLFEYGININNPSYFHLSGIDLIFLAYCTPQNQLIRWPWGNVIMQTAISNWTNIGLFRPTKLNQKSNIVRYQDPERYPDHYTTYCFDEMIITARKNILLNSKETLKRFQTALSDSLKVNQKKSTITTVLSNQNKKIKTLKDNKRLLYSTSTNLTDKDKLLVSNDNDKDKLDQRCQKNNLRISIQIRHKPRYQTSTIRAIVNLQEVIKVAKMFTKSVNVIRLNASSTFKEQYDVYNNFDILITSVGSHLTNMVLINHNKNVGIIELGIVVRDLFWKENAERFFGYDSYIISNGHIPDSTCKHTSLLSECISTVDHSDTILCPSPKDGVLLKSTAWKVTDCNYIVNLKMLYRHIYTLSSKICGVIQYPITDQNRQFLNSKQHTKISTKF